MKKSLKLVCQLQKRRAVKILMIMKLVAILLTIASLQVYSRGYSQEKITISVEKKDLKEVFAIIQKNSSYKIVYNDNIVGSTNTEISFSVIDANIETVLGKALENTNLQFKIMSGHLIAIGLATPAPMPLPPAEIEGVITDEAGNPIASASIIVKGTSIGVTSDVTGSFKLKSNQQEVTIVVSFVGYQSQEIKVKGNQTIVVKLKQATINSNSEVVVVGYGKQKKITTIGAQTTITVAELKQPVANISTVIAGRIAGIIGVQRSGEPGYDNASIWIRGISTFTNSDPLVLVDGVERPFNNIDPEDIESFSILKDASATAVYGVRGANGVILIMLKKGKAGKPSINAQINQGVTQFTRIPKFADGVTYMHMANEAYKNSNPSAVNPLYSDEAIRKTADGSDPDLYPNVDWYKEMFNKTGNNRRIHADVSGGSENAKYYLALSHYQEQGLYKVEDLAKYNYGVKFNRFNFTSNLNLNITKTTKLDFGASGFITNGNYPGNSASNIWNLTSLIPPIVHPPKYSNGLLAQQRSGDLWNPYAQLTQSGFVSEVKSQLWSNIRVTQELNFLLKGLSATTMFSFDNYNEHEIKRTKTADGYIATGRDADSNLIMEHTLMGDAYLKYDRSNGGNRRFYTESAINYANSFGNNAVTGMILYNQSDYLDAFAGNFMLSIPYRFRGLAGRVTYAYDNRYLAEANFGYNGSETFAPSKRYGFLPSFGLGWVASNEKFFESLSKIFQLLKFRYSWGIVGNSNIGDPKNGGRRFAYISTVDEGASGYTYGESMNKNVGGLDIGDYAVNVTWEKAQKSNLGVDMKLLNNELSITADIFKEKRTNIFRQRGDIMQYMGLRNAPWGNLGAIDNHGVDATLEYNKKINDFGIGFRGNFTWNHATIINDANAPWPYPWQQVIGRKLGQRFGLIALGLFQDEKEIANSPYQTGINKPGDIKYKDLNADGVINDKDKAPIGYGSIPEMVYGFGPTFSYKGFSIGAFFKGISKVDIYLNGSGLQPFSHGSTRGNLFTDIVDRWTPENSNPHPFYPRLTYGTENMNYEWSSWWVKNGAFLRLQNIEASYTLSKKSWFPKLGLSNLRIYFLGYNVATFSKFKMWDVELGDGKGAMYPLIKTYNIGIECKFK